MKYRLFLLAAIASFHLCALDQKAKELIDSIAEQMKEMPAPDYQLSLKELPTEKLETLIEEGEKRSRDKKWTGEEKELIEFVKSASQRYKFEGDEAEFHPEILANPLKHLGISTSEETPARKETILETCIEPGEFEREFLQTLKVTLLPESKKVKQCNGHHKIEKVSVKGVENKKERNKIANSKVNEFKNKFENDPSIKQGFNIQTAKDIHKTHIDIILDFHHLDDISECDQYQVTELPGTKIEKEEWVVEPSEEYAALIKNQNCKLALIHVEKGPETCVIEGKEIFREIWARNLLFHCSPDATSPCAKFREQGGQLVKKQCIRENEETGDCEIWEKTYDLGKAYPSETTYTFTDETKKIWGMSGELKPEPENVTGSDFSQVLGFMRTLSDMPLGEGKNLLDLDGNMPLFNGTVHKCNCHLIDELYDCCKDVRALWPAHCDQEEMELSEMREQGRCHKVGRYHNKALGVKTSKTSVYCCYPTKLLKIFNVEARKKMGLGWGKAKKPNCAGFSLEQMEGKIDLSTLDFSEAADDLKIDEVALAKEMTEKLRTALEKSELNNCFLEDPDVHQ